MTALEVVGAAAIWASFLAIGVFVGLTGFTFVIILLDRWRVTRAVWAFKTTGWISQDNLDHYLDGCAAAWGGGRVEHERAWCRADDYRAGMRAAAYHLVRDYAHILKCPRTTRQQSEQHGKAP